MLELFYLNTKMSFCFDLNYHSVAYFKQGN